MLDRFSPSALDKAALEKAQFKEEDKALSSQGPPLQFKEQLVCTSILNPFYIGMDFAAVK